MFPSWWRNLAKLANGKDKASRRSPHKGAKPRRGWRPMVEQLEDRLVPTNLSIPTGISATRGATVQVPINVDTLSDLVHGNSGLSGADFVVYFNPGEFTVSSVGPGTVLGTGAGWTISPNTTTPGLVIIGLSNSGTNISSTNGGSVVVINFSVKSNAQGGQWEIDLAAGVTGGGTVTDLVDQNFNPYTLASPPINNTTLNPDYSYSGSDPDDGSIIVTVTNLPPVANPDTYSVDSRDTLTVPSPGVLSNDTDPQGNPLQAVKDSNPTNGSLTFNSNGSFTYTPNSGFYGTDSFTYQAFDNQVVAYSNTTTVTINVTPRLSIPSDLIGAANNTVVVPVDIDDPNPMGGGNGLTGASLALDYNANLFTVTNADVQLGSVTTGWTLVPNVVATAGNGEIGISLTSPSPATSTVGGSLVLITFHVNGAATPGTLSQIHLEQSNSPSGNTVSTQSDTLSPQVTLSLPVNLTDTGTYANGSYQVGLDGSIYVAGTGSAVSFNVAAPPLVGVNLLFPVTVTALTSTSGTATGYTGTVQFSSTDPLAGLPLNYTFVPADNGVHTFSASLATQGTQTITASDTNLGFINGTSGPISVVAASVTHFAVTAPTPQTAGVPFNFTVIAENAANNPVPAYSGMLSFTSTDPHSPTLPAILPNSVAVTGGEGVFSATLYTAGPQTITATDANNITGTSNTIQIGAGQTSHFAIVGTPTAVTAGSSANFTVVAEDAYGNITPTYPGTLSFSTSDPLASPPGGTLLTSGTTTVSMVLKTAGSQTLSATDTVHPNINGTSNPISVTASAATHFVVAAPSSEPAGAPFVATVTAVDAYGNPATGYTGVVHFTSSDPQGVLPEPDPTLTNGVGFFPIQLKTAGVQTLVATDPAVPSINGGTAITITALAATAFTVTAPTNVTQGNPFTYTVTAVDQYDNTAAAYNGTVYFTSTDAQATLPTSTTLISGTGMFTGTLRTTTSTETVSATDTSNAGLTGTSLPITVVPASATHFSISAPSTTVAGNMLTYTVTALNQFNTVATTYTGTVIMSSTDAQAAFPFSTALPGGQEIFTTVLKTAGFQTITATDNVNAAIAGTSNLISVTTAAASHFVVLAAPSTLTAGNSVNVLVTAKDPYNNTVASYTGTVHFTSSDPQSTTPADSTLNNGTGTFTGTILRTSGVQTVTATDTTLGITGTSNNVTVKASATTHFVVVRADFRQRGHCLLVRRDSQGPVWQHNPHLRRHGAGDHQRPAWPNAG